MGNNESKGLTLTEKIIKNHIIDGEMIKGTEIGLVQWLIFSLKLWVSTE